MSCKIKTYSCATEKTNSPVTLQALIDGYLQRIQYTQRDDIESYKNELSLSRAIERAAHSERDDGKRHSHQYRIRKNSINSALEILSKNIAGINACSTFEQLHDKVEELLSDTNGLGELYIYDAAFRIGLCKKIYPEYVYLHAGTRKGAAALKRALGLTFDQKSKKILKSELPKEFAHMRPYMIEDFLCICREAFKNI